MIFWLIEIFHERKEENNLRHRKFSSLQYPRVFNSSRSEEEVGINLYQKQFVPDITHKGQEDDGETGIQPRYDISTSRSLEVT